MAHVLARALRRVRDVEFEPATFGRIFFYLLQEQGSEVAAAFAAITAQEVASARKRSGSM